MQLTLRPAMKKALPLAVAAMSLLPLTANTTKAETKAQKAITVEQLQADKYEKKGDDRIEAGLTKEEAYKDLGLQVKFNKANLNQDDKISEAEADIYNWGGKKLYPNYWSTRPSGLVLWSQNDAGGADYCVYPRQKYSESMCYRQKQLFKETDRNNDQTVSPTECLRQVKLLEIRNIDERIADGFYMIKSFKILEYIINNPKLLEDRADAKIDIK